MIRIAVTGSECTGKTTLAAALAEHYRAPWSGEFARRFVEEEARAPTEGDVEAIARGQMALEDELIERHPPLLIHDTDLLSTLVYSRHYFGSSPRWVERAVVHRMADLYLLADVDVPWIAEDQQRDRPHRRDEMQSLFRQALIGHGARFVEVSGTPERRLHRACIHIDPLLPPSPGNASQG